MKSKKELKEIYKNLIEMIRSVINKWDPYGLIASGAPKDEFDIEIMDIAVKVQAIHTEKDAILVISEVFSKWFNPKDFTLQYCDRVGKELFMKLKEEKFI